MIGIDLSGKTIFITGSLGAIAEHVVRKLVAAGATLVLTDIEAETEARRTLNDWQIPASSYLYLAADIACLLYTSSDSRCAVFKCKDSPEKGQI